MTGLVTLDLAIARCARSQKPGGDRPEARIWAGERSHFVLRLQPRQSIRSIPIQGTRAGLQVLLFQLFVGFGVAIAEWVQANPSINGIHLKSDFATLSYLHEGTPNQKWILNHQL